VQGFPFIRFYAGCPLVASNGLRLGSLCIIDRAPRTFDAESCALLANMAEMVVREVEKDKALDIEVRSGGRGGLRSVVI
jgi:GAF domain-containing protein